MGLGPNVEGRCCLIEDHDVRLMNKETSECNALLFSFRQRLIPRQLIVQTRKKLRKPNCRERSGDLFRCNGLARSRIDDSFAQTSRRYVWPLRNDKHSGSLRMENLSFPPWPASGEGPDKGAFAGSRFTNDEHLFPRSNSCIDSIHYIGAVCESH